MFIIESIKNFAALFAAKEFNDPYLWIMQQFGHLCISFIFCYLTEKPYLIVSFWLVWEFRHLILSGNFRDFLEDTFFELLGVYYFTSTHEKGTLIIILLALVIYCILRFELYKKQLT